MLRIMNREILIYKQNNITKKFYLRCSDGFGFDIRPRSTQTDKLTSRRSVYILYKHIHVHTSVLGHLQLTKVSGRGRVLLYCYFLSGFR